jgi:hypothetical protein
MVQNASRTRAARRSDPVRWVDICRVMRMMGYMEDYSKGECLRVHKQLKAQVKAGKARKIRRGLYQAIYRPGTGPEYLEREAR